ncbi:MAG TPA: Hsp33 family molecular chaperone HslO [Myxococcales bacterium]|jgi:molecular chaperone Hsp33|nr:Hsp33 family molecular chaperone HslO [Myxococcales bacterium]
MPDQLLVFAAGGGAHLAVCVASKLAREAAGRHGLAPGSASALAQALAGTLLLAASERRPPQARVDVQLECGGPLKGLLTDADASGAVRGLVRVIGLDHDGSRAAPVRKAGPGGPLRRFDPRPLLASRHDERAGMLSVVRAEPGSDELHRAAFPFAGGDLGAALTLFLRNDRARGGEMALEVLFRPGEPPAAVAGALLWAQREDEADDVRALGKPLRQGVLHESLLRAEARAADARGLAEELARALELGPLTVEAEVKPRFACRCSRERVVRALATLARDELRDMAERDNGAEASCDFCGARYGISAAELLQLAGDDPLRA